MLDLSDRQREMLIDKLPDAANVAAAGTIFGQAVVGQAFATTIVFSGFALWLGLMLWSAWLARRRSE